MPSTSAPRSDVVPEVVVVGGGFGGLESAFYLRHRVGGRAAVTLVSDQDHFLFKPNTIYVPFGKDPQDLRIPLVEASRHAGIRFVKAKVSDVDPAAKSIASSAGPIKFDYLVLATGAAMRPDEVPGLAQHANTIFTPDEMLRLRKSFDALLTDAKAGQRRRVVFLVPPNNKCSGPLYEIVQMLDTWLRRKGARDAIEIAYYTFEASFIQAFGPRLNEVMESEFARRRVEAHARSPVERVEEGRVRFKDGSETRFDLLVSFPPYVAATRYPALPSDERGFVSVDPKTRQAQGHEDIYVVGDAGDFPVKQAFLAFLQADAAAEHLSSRILGRKAEGGFDPVSMCIMEQYDKATFAQVPLRTTGDPSRPVEVRPDALEDYKVGSGRVWQVGKKMLGAAVALRFRVGKPFHAGASWATMEAGLNVMKALLAD